MTKDQRDLLKELRKLAKERGLEIEVLRYVGKGSHIRVRCGSLTTTLPAKINPIVCKAIKRQIRLD